MKGWPNEPAKTFQVAEANALLPKVIPLVQQLQKLHRSIVQTNEQLEEAAKKLATGNGYPVASLKEQVKELTMHQVQLIEVFQSALQQLQELGAILKDATIGLVDFYSVRDDELICLCWTLGEDRIRFWHDLDSGYAGRQPLDESNA